MIRVVSLLVPAVLLAACHVHGEGNDASNVAISADENGQVSFNMPFASGKVKIPEGAFHNGQFDIDGVKMIPGGTIHGFSMDAGDKGALVHLAFNAPKSPDEVRAYFLDQFKAKGDEASQNGTAISGKTKDGDTFLIDVQPADGGSQGTIAVQSKD